MTGGALSLAVAIGLATFAASTNAHHSIASQYDGTRQMTLEGVIAAFHFVNPHPFLTIEVGGDSGQPQRWRLEMDNRWELAAIGLTSATLKPGDRIVVVGSPARDRSPSLYVRRLDRLSDGFSYEQVGGRPRIRRG